jgi:hypothetical protein
VALGRIGVDPASSSRIKKSSTTETSWPAGARGAQFGHLSPRVAEPRGIERYPQPSAAAAELGSASKSLQSVDSASAERPNRTQRSPLRVRLAPLLDPQQTLGSLPCSERHGSARVAAPQRFLHLG